MFALPGSLHARAAALVASLAALLALSAARPAAAVTYTVKDVGAPTGYALVYYATNVFVNNTGQLIGLAFAPGSTTTTCMAYNGGKWFPIEGPQGLRCAWAHEGLSDADSAGKVLAVGQIALPTVQPLIGGPNNMFEAEITPSSSTLISYGSYSESTFEGINRSGLAAGFYNYVPMSGWADDIAAVIKRGTGGIAMLQPACAPGTDAGHECLYDPVPGARNVNAGSTILGYAVNHSHNTGAYVEVSVPTGNITPIHLPSYDGNNPGQPLGIDDAARIVYTQVTGTGTSAVYRFDPATGKALPLGATPGCAIQDGFWVNGPGDVFALVQSCKSYPANGYYLWTSAAGWSQVKIGSAPAGCSVYTNEFLQMNDKAQLGVNLSCGSVTHWALLCPTTAPCGGAPALAARAAPAPVRQSTIVAPADLPASEAWPAPAAPAAMPALAAPVAMPALAAPVAVPALAASRPTLAQPVERRFGMRPDASVTFKIDDIGDPPASAYSSVGSPVALNNTGQIVGQANPVGGYGRPTCVAWTGKSWVNLHPTDLGYYGCIPSIGLSDAVSGSFASAGATSYPTIGGSELIAYYAKVSASGPATTLFVDNSESQLSDMNKTGKAAGLSFYYPFGGWYGSTSPVASTGAGLGILQPACAAGGPACMLAPVSAMGGICNDNFEGKGARSITASGLVLGCSDTTGAFVEVSGTTGKEFTLPLTSGATLGSVVGVDDSARVIYQQNAPGGVDSAWRYDPSTKTSTALGKLAGSSCMAFVPLAVNGPGAVLGVTNNCSKPADNVYWLWTSAAGTRTIATAGGVKGETFEADWINDIGQILVELSGPGFSDHWGTLDP
jgi:hypothetical protein